MTIQLSERSSRKVVNKITYHWCITTLHGLLTNLRTVGLLITKVKTQSPPIASLSIPTLPLEKVKWEFTQGIHVSTGSWNSWWVLTDQKNMASMACSIIHSMWCHGWYKSIIVWKEGRWHQKQCITTASFRTWNIPFPAEVREHCSSSGSCVLFWWQFAWSLTRKDIPSTGTQGLFVIWSIQLITICIKFALIMTLSWLVWTTIIWTQCYQIMTISMISSSDKLENALVLAHHWQVLVKAHSSWTLKMIMMAESTVMILNSLYVLGL